MTVYALAGRRALVTGAAGGIGAAMARSLRAAGAEVAIADIDLAAAQATAAQLMANPDSALDTLAREELGLDPDALGSPVGAATSSFVAFAVGASVPVVPYLFFRAPDASTMAPFAIAVIAAVVALLVVGGLVGRLSGRGVVFSAVRQLAWGAGAALVTYAVGRLVGTAV